SAAYIQSRILAVVDAGMGTYTAFCTELEIPKSRVRGPIVTARIQASNLKGQCRADISFKEPSLLTGAPAGKTETSIKACLHTPLPDRKIYTGFCRCAYITFNA